jgi:hypothetical protein
MEQQCEFLPTCGFFNKYQPTKSLVCKVFIITHCKGTQMDECHRKHHQEVYGTPPPDNMLPNGKTFPS